MHNRIRRKGAVFISYNVGKVRSKTPFDVGKVRFKSLF